MSRHNALKVLGILVAAIALGLSLAPRIEATEYTWTNLGGLLGAWELEGNWTPLGGPPLDLDTATLSSTASGVAGTINLNGDRAVDTLNFYNNDATPDHSGSYTLKGGESAPDSALTVGTILQSAGVGNLALNEIQAKIAGGGGGGGGALAVSVVDGTLKLSGQIGPVAPVTLTAAVSGTLDIAGQGNQMTTDSRITVAPGGQLRGINGNLSAATIELAGGKLSLTGTQIGTGQGLLGEYYRNMDTGQLGPGLILAGANGTGFDRYSPGGPNYIGDANYQWGILKDRTLAFMPGNGDPNTNIFTGILDHNNNQVDPRRNVGAPYEYYACRWAGTLNVTTAGYYRFFSGSDDGNKVWVDGAAVVRNDYWQGYAGQAPNGPPVYLDAGTHTIVVGFYQGGSGHSLSVQWNNGTGNTAIPASAFQYIQTVGTGAFGNNVEVTATGSEIAASSTLPLSLGALKLNIGTSLAVSNTYPDSPVTFTGTNLSADGLLTGTPELNIATLFNGGPLMGALGADQLTKIGPGTATFTNLNSGSGAIGLNSNEGLLKFTGTVGAGGPLSLAATANANGSLSFTGTVGTGNPLDVTATGNANGVVTFAGPVRGTSLAATANAGGLVQFQAALGAAGSPLALTNVVNGGGTMEFTGAGGNTTGTVTVNPNGLMRLGGAGSTSISGMAPNTGAKIVLVGGTIETLGGAGVPGILRAMGWQGTVGGNLLTYTGGLMDFSSYPAPTNTNFVEPDVIDYPNKGDWLNKGRPGDWLNYNDNLAVLWTGVFNAPVAGTYNFSIWSDDESALEVDGARMVGANCNEQTGTRVLTAGFHTFKLGMKEGGGDEYMRMWWQKPGDAAREYANQTPGFFFTDYPGFMTTNEVAVTAAGSVINGKGLAGPGFGQLTMDCGTDLTYTHENAKALTFANTVITDVGAPAPVGMIYNNNVNGGDMQISSAVTLNKSGAGAANFGQLIVPAGGASLALNVNQGSMTFSGAVGVGGPLAMNALVNNTALTFQNTVTGNISATAMGSSGAVNFGGAVSGTSVSASADTGSRVTFAGQIMADNLSLTAVNGSRVQALGRVQGNLAPEAAVTGTVGAGSRLELTNNNPNSPSALTGAVTVNAGGELVATGPGTAGAMGIVMNGGLLRIEPVVVHGLMAGRIDGNGWNTTNIPTLTLHPEGIAAMDVHYGDVNQGPWTWDNTWYYTGLFYADGGNISFMAGQYDDHVRCIIDGNQWISDTTWANTNITLNLSPGWHTFEARFGQGGGGVGPVNGQFYGVGYDPLGRASGNNADYAPIPASRFAVGFENVLTAPISVVADSEIRARDYNSGAGVVSIDRGLNLTVNNTPGKNFTFAGTTVTENGAGPVGLIYNVDVNGGDLQTFSALNVNKSGAGAANFGRLIVPDGLTTDVGLSINQGSMKFSGQMGTETAQANIVATIPVNTALSILNTDPAAPNNITGSLTTNGGRLNVAAQAAAGTGSIGTAIVNLNGGLLEVAGSIGHPFMAGRINGNGWDTTTIPALTLHPEGISAMDVHYDPSAGPWVNDSTWYYTGSFYADGGPISFMAGYYDDHVSCTIDGNRWISDSTWAQTNVTLNLSRGWHSFEARFGQGGGGVGPFNGQFYAVGYDLLARGSGDPNDYTPIPASRFYEDPGATLTNAVNAQASSTINVNSPTTLGQLTLDPAVTLSTTQTAAGLPWFNVPSLAFAGTTLSGTGATIVGIDTGVSTSLGLFDDRGSAGGAPRTGSATVVKTGDSDLILDQTAVGNSGSKTTFEVRQGRLVLVGKVFENDPTGGARISVQGGLNPTIGLSSKGGDYVVPGAFSFFDSATLDARKIATGNVGPAMVSLTGGVTTAAGKTVSITTADNYTVNIPSAVTGGNLSVNGQVTLGGTLTGVNLALLAGTINSTSPMVSGTVDQSGGVFNINGGTLEGASTIGIGPGTMNANVYTSFGPNNIITVRPQGVLYLNPAAPAPLTPKPTVTVQGGGTLWGDVTSAKFSAPGQNVFLLGNSIIVPTAGVEPTPTELPSPVWRGATDPSGTFSNLGTNRSYQGVIFDSRWSGTLPQYVPGIMAGRIDGNDAQWWFTDGFPTMTLHLEGTAWMDVNYDGEWQGPWTRTQTWVYQGKFWWDGGNISFRENFDDNVLLRIDGQQWMLNTEWNNPTTSGTRALSAGWHDFEARFGQGGGGVGPIDDPRMGIGYDVLGRGTTNAGDYAPIPATRFAVGGEVVGFTGVLQEDPLAPDGFTVQVDVDMFFNNVKIDAASGHAVKITGSNKLALQNPWLRPGSTADTFVREGVAPTATDPGTMGREIVEFWPVPPGGAVLPSPSSLTIRNGMLALDGANQGRIATDQNTVINMDANSVLYLTQDLGSGTWNIMKDAWVRVPSNTALKNLNAKVSIESGAWAILPYNLDWNADWNSSGPLPAGTGLNVIVGNGDRNFGAGLQLANGGVLATGWYEPNLTLTGGAIRLADPNTGSGPIRILAAGVGGGGMTIQSDLDLTQAPGSYADLIVNSSAGEGPWLPMNTAGQGNTGAGSQFIDFQKRNMGGEVRLYGASNKIGALTVERGRLYLGNDLTDKFAIQGPIVAKAGVALQHNSAPDIMNNLAAGTLGTGIEMQGGTTLTQELRPLLHEDPDNPGVYLDNNPQPYAEQILFNATGSSAMSIWHLRNMNGDVGEVYQFPSVKMDNAYLQIERENFDVVQAGLDINGFNRLRRNNEPQLLSLTGDGELRVGSAAEGGFNLQVWGPIGSDDPAKHLKLIHMNGTIYLQEQSGWNSQVTIDLYRPDLPDYAGANLEVIAGNDGTVRVSGGVLNTGGGRSVVARALDTNFGINVPFGGPTNNIAARTNITTGQGYLRSARDGGDMSGNGTAYFSDVHMAPGTELRLESNDLTFAIANVALDGQKADSFTYTDGGDEWSRWLRDINGMATDGRNTLRIASGGRRQLGGMVTNTNVSIDVDGWSREEGPSPGFYGNSIAGFGLTNSALTLTHPRAWSEIWYVRPDSIGELNAVVGMDRTDGGRGTFYIRYGQSATDKVGENGWGSGLTANLDNGGRLDIYADRWTKGRPQGTNVNKFDAQINILNGTLQDIYNNGQWWANGRLRADRADPWYDTLGIVRLGNVHLAQDAVLHVSQGDSQLELRQVYLDGSTGTILSPENDWVRVFKVNGIPTGSTLNMTGNRAMQFRGALTNTNVVWSNTERMAMETGFSLNGNTVTMMPNPAGYQGWAEVRGNPGTGTFTTTQTVKYDWWRGRVDLNYGEYANDTIGEAGWGNNVTINADGGQAIRLYANKRANGGADNLNIFNGRINVGNTSKSDVGNVTGGNVHNAMLRSEREDPDSNQLGWAVYTNVHMADGAELAVSRGDAALDVRNLYLDGATAGYINWNDWTFLSNVTGTQASPSALNIHNGSNWMYMMGKLTNANVTYNNTQAWDAWLGLIGPNSWPYRDLPVPGWGNVQPGFEMDANSSLTVGDVRFWLFADPKAGTINYTARSFSEPESYMKVGYGNAKNDCPGDAWGSNLTINLDAGRMIGTFVNRPAGGQDNINQVDARINIGNQNSAWWFGGTHAGVNGRIRAYYTGTSGGGAGGFVYYSNVHLAQGTVVSLENDSNNVYLRANLTLDGTEATARINDDWEAIRNITGTQPGSTLHLTSWSPTDGRAVLFTGSVTNTDISIENHKTDAWNRANFLMPGFQLNGNRMYRANAMAGPIWVDGNPGTGTLESLFGYADDPTDRAADIELRYGRLDTDTVGDNGWGSGLTINLGGGQSRALLRAMRNPGFVNVNKFDGRINIVNNVGGQDARIWGGRTEGTPFPNELFTSNSQPSEDTGGSTPLAWFTNIHLSEGSLTRLETWDANMRTDFYLEGNAAYGWWNGQGAEKEVHAYSTGDRKTLTFQQLDPVVADWPVDNIRVTLHGTADFAIDSRNCTGARTASQILLNGNNMYILATSDTTQGATGRDWPIELRPEAPDLNGTVYLTGWYDGARWRGGDFEIRVGRTGSPGVLPLTSFEISNGRMLRQMVADAGDGATPLTFVSSPIHIIGDGVNNTPDGMLAACESDGNPGGRAPGYGIFKNVTLDDWSYLALRSANRDRGGQGDTKIVAGGWEAGQGIKYRTDPAYGDVHGIGIVNETTINNYTAYVGNIGPDTGATPGIVGFFHSNGMRTTLVGQLTASQLWVGSDMLATAGRLEVERSASLNLTPGGPVAVSATSQLILRAPYPAASPLALGNDTRLVLGHPTFAPPAFQVGNNVEVQLDASANWTVGDGGDPQNQRVVVGMCDYAGSLTVNRSDSIIGVISTNAAGILNPITGTAGTFTFRDNYGGNLWLKLGNDGPAVISDVALGTPRSVVIDRNLAICAANDYTGPTTIQSHTTRACNASSLGTSEVTVASGATLQLRALNLTSGKINVNTGATLAIYQSTLSSDIQFNGGWVNAPRDDVTASGQTIDNGDMHFNVAAGKTLTFDSPGLDMNADRIMEVASGTVLFAGNVTGVRNINKTGPGTLRMEGGGNLINTLAITSGGVVITLSPLAPPEPPAPAPVTVAAGSFYTVGLADHGYGEVNMGASNGVLALGEDSVTDLTFANASMSLGAYNTWGETGVTRRYTGNLTPFNNVYMLGGGADQAALEVASTLQDLDGDNKRTVQIAWPGGGNDPLPKGLVILSGANTFLGNLDVYGPLAIPAGADVALVVGSALAVNVYDGGAIDFRGNDFSSLVDPLNRKLNLAGGGVASHGATLTAADVLALFPNPQQDYVLGAGGVGTTQIDVGALTSALANLTKVGTDTVKLLGDNTGVGRTTVTGGRLIIDTLGSLGLSDSLNVMGSGIAQLVTGGAFNGLVSLADKAELSLAPGETLTVAGLAFASGTPSIVGTGATLDTGGACVQGNVPVDLKPGVTLLTKLGSRAEMGSSLFKIREGSTLRFTSATPSTDNAAIGSMYPGASMVLDDNLVPAGQFVRIARNPTTGGPGIKFDVDQAAYDADPVGAVSSPDNPYHISVGAGYWLEISSEVGSLQTAILTGECMDHRPVAWIQKEGPGEVRSATTWNPGQPEAKMLAWIVQGGTLSCTAGPSGLGITGGSWISLGFPERARDQHLEAMIVKDGATLAWRGEQAFLPASYYGGLPGGAEGDGFNPGEFILEDNATLTNYGTYPFIMGVPYPGGGFPLWPTIRSSTGTSVPNVTIKGNVMARSGLAVDTSVQYGVPGGLTNLTVSGTVLLSNDVPGNPDGLNGVGNLTHTDGTTTITAAMPNMKSMVVTKGKVVLAPTGAVQVGTNNATAPVDLASAGNLYVQSGSVDMTKSVITSTAPFTGFLTGLNAGRIDGNGWDTMTIPVLSNHPEGLAAVDASYGGENQGPWTNNNTWYYTGQFYADGGNVSFMAGQYDDHVRVIIDGVTNIADTTWANTTWTLNLTAGWHSFEARFGQGGGGVGPANGQFYAVGYDPLGRASGNNADYSPIPAIRFRAPGTDGIVAVDTGATLKAKALRINKADVKGMLVIGNDGTNRATSTVKILTLAADSLGSPTATLDVTNGALLIDYTGQANPIADVQRWIKAAYDNNNWDLPGITSSKLQAGGGMDKNKYGVGYADNATLPPGNNYNALPESDPSHVWFGTANDLVPAPAASVLVKTTYLGDVNLDGKVDDKDVTILVLNYDRGLTSNKMWQQGDVAMYDGKVDDNDVSALVLNYGEGWKPGKGAPLGDLSAGASNLSAVPEPATLALLGLGGLMILVRRRRRH